MKRSPWPMRLGIVCIVCALAVRPLFLYWNTHRLQLISRRFPRTYTVGAAGSRRTITYVVLGDSTVQGTGAQSLDQTLPYRIAAEVAARGYRVKVINLAVVGATIADVESKQLDQLGKLHADLITLNVGANDATHFTDFLDFDRHMAVVLNEITAYPSTVVAVADTPDLSCVPALVPVMNTVAAWRARRQNVMLRSLCAGSQIHLVDLFADGKLTRPQDYAADQFHPSAQGYAAWAALYEPLAKSV